MKIALKCINRKPDVRDISYSVSSFYSSASDNGSRHPRIDVRFHKERKETLENVQKVVVR